MNRTTLALLALLALLLAPLAGCTSAKATPSDALTEADVQAIRAVDAAWCELAMSGEFERLAERCYAADAVLLPPNEPAAKGRAAIAASLRAWPRMTDVVIRSDEVVGRGDLAYATGTYRATMHVPGAAPAPEMGKFVVIFRRDAEGAWKMQHDCFSSDLPAK